MRWLVILGLVLSCATVKDNLHMDVSAGGEELGRKGIFLSTGVSYPVVGDLWASAGLWTWIRGGAWGPYWGLSYAWAPFKRLK